MKIFKLTTSTVDMQIKAECLDDAIDVAEEELVDQIDITSYSSSEIKGYTRKEMDSVVIKQLF